MDLALLVYGISLLEKLEAFVGLIAIISGIAVLCFGMYTISWKFEGMEYSWNLDRDGNVKEPILRGRQFGEKLLKTSFITLLISSFIVIFIPNEKTAYTMVGAYAAQQIVQNDKVQETGGKVLTIINQKLDSFIEAGIKEAEKKATNATKGKDKSKD